MAVNTKTIKSRIKSIGSTKKITKAMQMISAVKMKRAVAGVLRSRDYARLAYKILLDISKKTNADTHPLLQNRPVKKIRLILIAGNRGLCGGFNAKIITAADEYIKKAKAEHGATTDVVVLGRKARKIYTNFGHNVSLEFEKKDVLSRVEEILPISRMAIEDYVQKKYDRLVIVYTDYVSAIKQVPRVKELLPFVKLEDSFLGKTENQKELADEIFEFKFEPSPEMVLTALIPRLVEMQIYQAIMESDASEHSARMVSMQNATDAAEDIMKELERTFNKARQAAITKEIAEIVGGAAALE